MTSRRREQLMLITSSLVVLAAVAIAFILWYTRAVMIPFVLAVFVVVVVAPLADFLETRLRFRRWMSVLTVLVVVLFVAAACLLLLTYTVGEIATAAGMYATKLYNFVAELIDAEQNGEFPTELDQLSQLADQPAADVFPAPQGQSGTADDFSLDLEWIKQQVQPLIKGTIVWGLNLTRRGVGSVFGIVATFFLMVIFVLFLLAARDPKRLQHRTYTEIESKIRSYIATKTAISTVTAVLVGGILALFGMQLAVVFGVLTFLLNFIPSVGSIIATLLPLPIAYGQFVATANEPSWWMVLAVIALPGAVQMAIGNIVEPRIMGEGVGLHPIVILFALAFWGLLWGPVGAILAVPITAVVRIAIFRFDSFRLVADAMAGKLPGQADDR